MFEHTHFSRRAFLRWSALAGSGILAACAPKIVTQTVVVEKPVTQVIEKQVTQVVEKQVTQVVEVTKEVGPKSVDELLPTQDKLGSPDHAKGWKTTLPDLPPGMPAQDPVVITCTRRVDAQTTFCTGDDLENNPWSRMIQALFNVKYQVAWTWSTSDEAMQKYNLASASGDIPDFLETVPETVFLKMVQAGQLEDLTDAYTAYASPRWQTIWSAYGDLPWVWSKVDGRLYGISRVEDLAHNDCIMWYRQDWLEKAGKSVPTTFQDVHDLALTFAQGNYGPGAPGTTIGLLASAAGTPATALYHTWAGSIDFFWGGYGYIPDHWDPEGSDLMYAAIRPEMKDALAVLAQWYKDGVFARDFYTYDTSKAYNFIGANLTGLHFTPSWGAPLDSVTNDPNAKWQFADIPTGPNGYKRRHTENNFRNDPFAFRKGAKNIQMVFTITDWWDQAWHDTWRMFFGWEGCNYTWTDDSIKQTTVYFQNWTPGFVGTRGSGFLDPKQPATAINYTYNVWGKIPPDQRNALQTLVLTDPTGTVTLGNKSRLFILQTASEGMITKFQSVPTATMVTKGADLDKLRDQTYINIIIGQQPISDFDKFVTDWKSAGGDQVTAEVNQWWAAQPKS